MSPAELADAGPPQVPAPSESGARGQESGLGTANVLVIGAGALGAPLAAYLAGAGVARIGLVDEAQVVPTAGRRGLLYGDEDVGRGKAERAAATLFRINPDVQVDPYPARLEDQNAVAIFLGHDLVVDCSNDEATRECANRACVELGVPLVVAAASGSRGFVVMLHPGRAACLGCVPPELLPSVGAGDATPPLAGAVGSLAALRALERLRATEAGDGEVIQIDAARSSMSSTPVARAPRCPVCGAGSGAGR